MQPFLLFTLALIFLISYLPLLQVLAPLKSCFTRTEVWREWPPTTSASARTARPRTTLSAGWSSTPSAPSSAKAAAANSPSKSWTGWTPVGLIDFCRLIQLAKCQDSSFNVDGMPKMNFYSLSLNCLRVPLSINGFFVHDYEIPLTPKAGFISSHCQCPENAFGCLGLTLIQSWFQVQLERQQWGSDLRHRDQGAVVGPAWDAQARQNRTHRWMAPTGKTLNIDYQPVKLVLVNVP